MRGLKYRHEENSYAGQDAHDAAPEAAVGNGSSTQFEDVRKHFGRIGCTPDTLLDLDA